MDKDIEKMVEIADDGYTLSDEDWVIKYGEKVSFQQSIAEHIKSIRTQQEIDTLTISTNAVLNVIAEGHHKILDRLNEIQNSPPPYSADKENPMKHVYQNEGYSRAIDEAISSIKGK